VSLRKRSVMREILTEVRCREWDCTRHDIFRDMEVNQDSWWRTEDTFVAKMIHKHSHHFRDHLPNQRQSAEFSLEHMVQDEAQPFFVHKAWLYQAQTRWVPLLAHVRQYYPELG
jgi:hypothetical protein